LLVGLRPETWKNLAFNLFVNIFVGWVFWGLFTALICLGGTLIPFCFVGVLVLVAMLQIARYMAVAEISILNAFSPRSSRAYRPMEKFDADMGMKGWITKVVCSLQSYKDLLYLWLLKAPAAMATCLITGILVGCSLALIASPIVFGTCDTCMKNGNLCLGTSEGDWNNGTCSGWKIDSFGDSVGLFLVGVILLILTLHVSNGLAWLTIGMGKWMLAYDTTGHDARQPLISSHNSSTQTPSVAPVNYSAPRQDEQIVVAIIDSAKPTD